MTDRSELEKRVNELYRLRLVDQHRLHELESIAFPKAIIDRVMSIGRTGPGDREPVPQLDDGQRLVDAYDQYKPAPAFMLGNIPVYSDDQGTKAPPDFPSPDFEYPAKAATPPDPADLTARLAILWDAIRDIRIVQSDQKQELVKHEQQHTEALSELRDALVASLERQQAAIDAVRALCLEKDESNAKWHVTTGQNLARFRQELGRLEKRTELQIRTLDAQGHALSRTILNLAKLKKRVKRVEHDSLALVDESTLDAVNRRLDELSTQQRVLVAWAKVHGLQDDHPYSAALTDLKVHETVIAHDQPADPTGSVPQE